MNTAAIIQQLQDKLIKKYDAMKVELSEEELEEMFGPGFNTQSYLSFDNTADLDDEPEAVNTPYVTHRPFALPRGTKRGNVLPVGEAKETDEDDVPAEDEVDMAAAAGEQAAEEATGEEIDPEGMEGQGDMTGDMGEMGAGDMAGGDMGDTGMDQFGQPEEEEKTSSELGRIYELKKIYARLTSIESYLGNESDQELLQIRNYVSQGIELFEIVSSNFKSYKDKLDEIIVMYYKFLLEVYKSAKDIYSKQSRSGDK